MAEISEAEYRLRGQQGRLENLPQRGESRKLCRKDFTVHRGSLDEVVYLLHVWEEAAGSPAGRPGRPRDHSSLYFCPFSGEKIRWVTIRAL